MNLRKYNMIKNGGAGLCSILCGIGYLSSNEDVIFVLWALWMVCTFAPAIYLKNKKIDIEDELAIVNKWKAGYQTMCLLCLLACLLALFLLFKHKSFSINFGHISIIVGVLIIFESIYFVFLDRTTE